VAAATNKIQHKKAIIELLTLISVSIVVVLISMSLDIHEKFMNFVINHESWELDDIIVSGAFCLLFSLIWSDPHRLDTKHV